MPGAHFNGASTECFETKEESLWRQCLQDPYDDRFVAEGLDWALNPMAVRPQCPPSAETREALCARWRPQKLGLMELDTTYMEEQPYVIILI